MTNPNIPQPPQDLEYYLPEEIGLNDKSDTDIALYVQSGGLREAGELLLQRRQVTSGYDIGTLDQETYHQQLDSIDHALAQVFLDHQERALDLKG